MLKTITLVMSLSLFFSGCSLFKVAPQPTAPKAPQPPEEIEFFHVKKPDLPQKSIKESLETKYKDAYFFDMTPKTFPVNTNDLMVIAVPKDAAKKAGHGTVSTSEKDMRVSILAGFLDAGYRVKDAGVLNTVTFSMRRYPASDEETVTVRKKEFKNEESVETTSSRKPGSDYWWYNKGLTLNMNDPTSLWAPELLSYSSLKAKYFMRIFEFEFGESSTNLKLENKYDAVQRKQYSQQIDEANKKISERNQRLQKYHNILDNYNQLYSEYESKYNKYVKDFASWKNPFYMMKREGDLVNKVSKKSLSRPVIISKYSTSSINSISTRTENVPEEWVRFSAEIIDVKTGNVVWVGSNIYARTKKTFDSKSRLLSGIASRFAAF